MTRALRFWRFPAFVTLALLVALAVLPGRAELLVRLYALVIATFVVAQLLERLRRSLPERTTSPVDAALARRPRPVIRVPELEKIEREVTLGLTTAFDLHFRGRTNRRHSELQEEAPPTFCRADRSARSARLEGQ